MRLEHHLVDGYVRYISPHIITYYIIIIPYVKTLNTEFFMIVKNFSNSNKGLNIFVLHTLMHS